MASLHASLPETHVYHPKNHRGQKTPGIGPYCTGVWLTVAHGQPEIRSEGSGQVWRTETIGSRAHGGVVGLEAGALNATVHITTGPRSPRCRAI